MGFGTEKSGKGGIQRASALSGVRARLGSPQKDAEDVRRVTSPFAQASGEASSRGRSLAGQGLTRSLSNRGGGNRTLSRFRSRRPQV